ncbi:MAG: SDR family oxidoreductase [Acidobacteriaceae bacterium]|nr:SDR family oxidoreductase [Acidobacteriaceae bacterium]
MAESLNDKVVLVIGASSGIGHATAEQFAQQGAKVMASARRTERLLGLQEKLRSEGSPIEIHAADATRTADMNRLAQETTKKLGRIEILVFATGTNTPDRAMSRLNPDIWAMMINVNLNGAYYATQAVLPAMREARDGHLIYISSISGLTPDASGASYQAAKRGLVGFAHAVRLEEKENGIRTCVVCPGMVDTELLEKRPVKPSAETLKLILQPEDVADAVIAVAKMPARVAIPELQILPALVQ